ncbi:ribonuclease HII [Silvibacterium sp.]|uniref:ribonuclease HII n=1 Tax=Silvibacterium sp. TaxID=1964179 RepID=UPI0039E36416
MPRNFELTSQPAKAEREVSAATRKLRMLRTLVCGNKYEKAAREQGAVRIAGVDEVGRGCLFGPVVAAAVILPPETKIRGLRDSKQLTQEDRERLADIVRRKALAVSIIEIDSETIDRVNIYQATKLAMTQAVLALSPEPDHLLIDAMRLELGPGRNCTQTSIIYGDSLSISIAAASVVAKVYRDKLMCELDAQYPEYGLAAHKGYSTPVHLAALEKHGPTPLHRRSFRPVAMASLPWDSIHHGTQLSLLDDAEFAEPVAETAESALMAEAALEDAVVDEALAGEPLAELLEEALAEE